MGWDRATAGERKEQAYRVIADVVGQRPVTAAARLGGAPIASSTGALTVGVALGLRPLPDGSFGLAVRYRLGTPTARMVVRRILEDLGTSADDERAAEAKLVDVRRIGRIRALRPPADAARAASGAPGDELPAPPPTARALGETTRIRPLRPGVSVAHRDVSAGTLGGFVLRDGQTYLLSNHHVLVGDTGQIGDPILQPGPYDGGTLPQDRAGQLAHYVPLVRGQSARVDAALGTIDDPQVDLAYPAGLLTGVSAVSGQEEVEKVGRTTGITRGVVTAIELDGVLVNFGPHFGTLSFDDQIEVESIDDGPFSQGGDSGSVVYRPDTSEAVGLLFAGSDQGGSNGQGLTFLNPIGNVLEALGATWPPVSEAPPETPALGPGEPVRGGADQRPPLLTQDEARLLLRSVRSVTSRVPGVTGVGLRRLGPGERGYAVAVNVVDHQTVAALPESLRETVLVRVTGMPRALEDGGASTEHD